VEPPVWLTDKPPFPATDVLPAKNVLVHLPSYVEGKPLSTCQPTPQFFCPYALDYAFDPAAPIPQTLIDFLASAWPEDAEAIDTLQEWLGYLLTPDTSHQKIALLIGPPRSGRGTIGRLTQKLIGPCNVASPTLSGLATQFGAGLLIGKPVAIIGDARLSRRSDPAIALERLLSISGEDSIQIDRKNKPPWEGKLPTRMVMISNELPKFADASGALASRFLLLRFTRSFLGKEDKTLDAKLQAELPGILNWAIEGWSRLRKRGRFVQPASGQELIDQFKNMASPVAAFIEDRVDIDPGSNIPVKDLFEGWKDWCATKNRNPGSEQTFGRDLYSVMPALKVTQPRVDGKQVRHYEGIGLKIAF
jgi:putative DNA primase/helicase